MNPRPASASSSASDLGDRAAELVHAAGQAPQAVKRQTRGNPLMAGAVAFGTGVLVAYAMPASTRERAIAEQVRERAEPLVEHAREAAADLASEVKDTAAEEAHGLADHAKGAADDLKQEASDGAGEVSRPPRTRPAGLPRASSTMRVSSPPAAGTPPATESHRAQSPGAMAAGAARVS